MQQRKILLIVGDGMGDRPIAELDGRTPLAAAQTPVLDELAAAGTVGLMDPIAPGICAGSDTAHLALLGYDPYEYYTGRGPLEAAGVGLRLREGDVAFRCNFSTVEERSGELIVRDRRAGRIKEGTRELARALDGVKLVDGRVTALFRESIAHRAALVLRGDGLSGRVIDVDPHVENELLQHCKPSVGKEHPEYAAARRTAEAVNEFVALSHRVLEEHELNEERRGAGQPPANCILPRGGGLVPHIPAFPELRGVRAAALVEVGLLTGLLGRYLGLDLLECPGATGGLDTDIEAMASTINAAWDDYDFIFCNVKAPDLAGHDDNPREKVRACEMVDRLLGLLRDLWQGETILAVTADHSTPCECMDHAGDPVPLLVHGPAVRPDCGETFDEFTCPAGSLGRLRGDDLLPVLLNLANRYTKFGA
jgi:2,3-bisphosphoglycerate-independent phosphoglycerate mutase